MTERRQGNSRLVYNKVTRKLEKVTNKPKDDDRIAIDAPRVTPDQATELVAHHLALAAAYFEAVPEGEATLNEISRLIGEDDDRARAPAEVWLTTINKYYEDMKDND